MLMRPRPRAEIYATGRANLPGSTRERDMLGSFARMLPELLRHSDRQDVFEKLPAHLKAAHRPRDVERDDAPGKALPAPRPAIRARGAAAKRAASAVPALEELWGAEGDFLDPLADAPPLAADGDSDDEALLVSAGF